MGNRLTELLTRDGTLIRAQTNTYNSRGWLTGVDTNIDFTFAGATLNLRIPPMSATHST